MQFAIDSTSQRIQPQFSGQKAKCPLCGGDVIGKCGDHYAWHWQHKNIASCDSWHEPETQWHLTWKSRFRQECQEVIIIKDGIKHIADVQAGATTIEFQNSPISSRDITKREQFYGSMIWIVNAAAFENNFKIASKVLTEMKKAEQSATLDRSQIESVFYDSLNEADTITFGIKQKLEDLQRTLTNVEKKNRILRSSRYMFDSYFEQVLFVIKKPYLDPDDPDYEIIKPIAREYNYSKNKIEESVRSLRSSIESKKQDIGRVKKIPGEILNGVEYKKVDYYEISPDRYHLARYVSKADVLQIFPQYQGFRTKQEFLAHEYKKANFEYFIDPSERLNTIEASIVENEQSLDRFLRESEQLTASIKTKIYQQLENAIEKYTGETTALRSEIKRLEEKLAEEQEEADKNHKRIYEAYDADIKKVDAEKESKVRNAMMKQKGKYSYKWKHERISWRVTQSNLYFDVGKDYLFLRGPDGFTKVMIKEFMRQFSAFAM